jgi:hypothetical protein
MSPPLPPQRRRWQKEEVPWTKQEKHHEHNRIIKRNIHLLVVSICSILLGPLQTKVQGPMKWSNGTFLLNESPKLESWPLHEGPKTKKWQIKDKPTWHHVGVKINWFETTPPPPALELKRRAHNLKNQDAS